MRKIVLGAMLMAVATPAMASEQVFVQAALFYATETTKVDDNEIERTNMFYQVGLGLEMNGGLLLGGKYVVLDKQSEDEDNNESSTSVSGYGPMIGYMHDGWLGLGLTYLLEPQKEFEGGATYKGGSGYVIDIGFYIDQGGYSFGPMISWVSATYKESEDNGETIDFDSDYEEIYNYPYLGLFFFF